MRDILAHLLEEQEEAVQRETALPDEEKSAAGGYLPPLVEKSAGRSAVETQADFRVEREKDGRETAASGENPEEGEQDGSETQREQLSQLDLLESSKQFNLGAEWESRISAKTEPFLIGRGQVQRDGQDPLNVERSKKSTSLVDRGQEQGDEHAPIPASVRGVAESWAERVLKILPDMTASFSVKKSDSVPEGVAPKRAPVPIIEPSGENVSLVDGERDAAFAQAEGREVQKNRRTWSSGTLYSTLRRWESAASWPESAGRSAPVPLSAAASQPGGAGGLTMEQLDRAAQRDARRFDAPFPLY